MGSTSAASSTPTAGTLPAASSGLPDDTAGTVAVSTLGAALISEQPEVQPHAVEQARAEATASAGADKNGEHFNPAIHASNADGSPRKTMTGAWAKKRGKGAQQGAAATGPAKVNIPGAVSQTPSAPSKEQLARRGGAGAANLLLMLGIGLGGEEWHPRKDEKTGMDEKAMLEEVFGDYFVATDKTDLPPGWALLAGIGMYAGPRFAMPKTRTRMQRVKAWFGAKIVQWKARRAGLKVKVTAQEMDDRDQLREAAGHA